MSYVLIDGTTEDIVFTATRDSAAFDLSGITSVTLHREAQDGTADTTDDLTGNLSVTDAANGEVTLTGYASTYWDADKVLYHCWLVVVKGGVTYRFPGGNVDGVLPYLTINVIEG